MFPPLRRWRPLLAIAAIWFIVGYFFFFDDSSSYTSPNPPKPRPPAAARPADGKVHWSKLPDRFPVTSYRALPTGEPVSIPRIQLNPPPTEDKAAQKTREARLGAVKESFMHSWDGYRQNAWLSDEVAPLTGQKKDPFGGWAATLVDALDTLWIMGLHDEFKQAVKACEGIDFTTTETKSINVFETTIRYMGGFLAAYELSDKQFPTLLNKAVEVAELVMCAFDTPARMPISRWDWKE